LREVDLLHGQGPARRVRRPRARAARDRARRRGPRDRHPEHLMGVRIQIVSIVAIGFLLIGVLELVRRRRLQERYALLWLFSTLVLLVLAVWRGFLADVAKTVGIAYPPSALFVIAFG